MSQKTSDRIVRITGILYKLMQKQDVTTRELSDFFGVSIRTIQRDIDVISCSGIPIYVETPNGSKHGSYVYLV